MHSIHRNIMWVLQVFVILILGCSHQKKDPIPIQFQELENLTVYSTDAKPATRLSFIKDAVYGDSKEVMIGTIQDVAVDRLGRVFIADARQLVINVFEPGGRFITQIGRDGRGPNEFGSIKRILIQGDRLYAFDPGQFRMNIFSLENLAGEKTVTLAENRSSYGDLAKAYPYIDQIVVRNDDTYIAKFIEDDRSSSIERWQNFNVNSLYYLLDKSGAISRRLLDFPDATRTRFPLRNAVLGLHLKDFFGNSLTVISSDHRMFLAEPDFFLVKQFSSDGVYQHAFYYPIRKIPLTTESTIVAGVPDLYVSNMESLDLPGTWPALIEMKIDNQDRLWIATTVDDLSVYEWWVLESTGELITRFEWPRNKPILVVGGGFIYTQETDNETRIEQIVRYKIDFN